MSKMFRFLTVVPFIALLATSGCASRRAALEKQVSMLNEQVIALTNEVTSISDNQQALERVVRTTESRQQQIESQSPRRSTGAKTTSSGGSKTSGGVTVQGGVYRTPSGFELPVRSIQTALQNAGYYNGTIDGIVGAGTEEAIRRFQKDIGLEADGIVGRKTWARLKETA